MVEYATWENIDIDREEFVVLHEIDKSLIYRNKEIYLEISNTAEVWSSEWLATQLRATNIVEILNQAPNQILMECK